MHSSPSGFKQVVEILERHKIWLMQNLALESSAFVYINMLQLRCCKDSLNVSRGEF